MTDDNILVFRPRPYQTTQSTIDAFWYMVRLDDEAQLTEWLKEHPKDRATLLQIYREHQDVEAQG